MTNLRMASPAVAAAADDNFVVHAAWAAGRTAGMRTWIRPAGALVDAGLACDTFNLACRTRFPAAAAPQHIAEARAFFAGGSGLFSWWVGPADEPSHLGRLLEAAGLAHAGGELLMAASLLDLPARAELPTGLEIRRVRDAAQLEQFALAIDAQPEALRFYQLAAPVLLQPQAPQWFYLGCRAGRPVATLELCLGGGVGGLYNITTRAAQRGQGIATALTWQALHDARAAGVKAAVLQAAPAGVGVYRRLGFAAYGDIVEYKPPPQAGALAAPT
jgi:ribosomal protein S18 acetylase RimI-like enzyme